MPLSRRVRVRLLAVAGLAVLLLPALACGGSTSQPQPTPLPTFTPTGAVAPPTAAPTAVATEPPSPWSEIVAAYIGPKPQPEREKLLKSFRTIMTAANRIVMDRSYSKDETARAQAIFDAAADAHDALLADNWDLFVLRWESLGRFVFWLQKQGY